MKFFILIAFFLIISCLEPQDKEVVEVVEEEVKKEVVQEKNSADPKDDSWKTRDTFGVAKNNPALSKAYGEAVSNEYTENDRSKLWGVLRGEFDYIKGERITGMAIRSKPSYIPGEALKDLEQIKKWEKQIKLPMYGARKSWLYGVFGIEKWHQKYAECPGNKFKIWSDYCKIFDKKLQAFEYAYYEKRRNEVERLINELEELTGVKTGYYNFKK